MLLENLRRTIYQDLKDAALKAREKACWNSRTSGVCSGKAQGKVHGDLATNLALVLARPAKSAPRKIAQIILDHFPTGSNRVERCEWQGLGLSIFSRSLLGL